MQMDMFLTAEFWQKQLGGFQSAFWSMSLLLAGIVLFVWWLRGKKIDSLEEQISVLERRLIAQIATKNGEISAMEQRLKLAAELMVAAGNAMDDVVKQYHAYREQVDSSGWNASPVRIHLAIGRLIQQKDAISPSALAGRSSGKPIVARQTPTTSPQGFWRIPTHC
jgi:hypothetical protein